MIQNICDRKIAIFGDGSQRAMDNMDSFLHKHTREEKNICDKEYLLQWDKNLPPGTLETLDNPGQC